MAPRCAIISSQGAIAMTLNLDRWLFHKSVEKNGGEQDSACS
jgi:hypothetical protein